MSLAQSGRAGHKGLASNEQQPYPVGTSVFTSSASASSAISESRRSLLAVLRLGSELINFSEKRFNKWRSKYLSGKRPMSACESLSVRKSKARESGGPQR